MNLLLVRHAIAAERGEFGGADADRPLTAEGRARFARAARALVTLAPALELVATSPLVRARETALLLREASGGALELVELAALSPGSAPEEVVAELAAWRAEEVALVGHEPDLSRLAGYLLAGAAASFLRFKKGGAARLEVAGRLRGGAATLVWHLTPGQLRELAR